MTLSYVPVLAGYSPVPYEEMQASVAQPAERNESAPFCEKHGVSFIHQRAKDDSNRTWYSHPADDEPRGWCNYKKAAQPAQPSQPADPADPLRADSATWEPFIAKVKAERGETAQTDLALVIEGGHSPKVLRANALRHGLKTPDELFALCTEQWAIRDSDTLFPED